MSFLDQLHAHLTADTDAPMVREIVDGVVRGPGRRAFAEQVARVRGALEDAEVAVGDRVVLLAPNSVDWVATDLGILLHGAVCVPLYARQAVPELVGMMQDCDPALVIVDGDDLLASVRDAWPEVPAMPLADLAAASPSSAPPAPRAPEDVVTFVYTSGTSGEPKGAMITRANVDAMLPCTAGALGDLTGQPAADDTVFHYLPCCFMGSRLVLWTCLWRDSGIVLETDLDRLADDMAIVAPTYFLNVPVLLERVRNGADAKLATLPAPLQWLLRAAEAAFDRQVAGERVGTRGRLALSLADRLVYATIRARFGPNLRFLICGSAPLGEDTQRWFERLGIPVRQVYGLTETTAIVTMDTQDEVAPGRVGVPLPVCEVRTSDEGELQVRGPAIFPGYWHRPDATAAAFTEDGWFRTGDQCDVDEAGRWRVIGRVKNLLVPTSGHNVAPEPLEQKLLETIPGAEQVVLVGHARPHLTALVFGDAGDDAIQGAIDALNPTLPSYKRVRAWHRRADPLTDVEGLLTANGKLKRAAIEAAFAGAIDGMYAA